MYPTTIPEPIAKIMNAAQLADPDVLALLQQAYLSCLAEMDDKTSTEHFVETLRLRDELDARYGSHFGLHVLTMSGVLVGTGDQLTSAAGRHLAPAPRIDTTTDRRWSETLKRLKEWLCEEVVAEAWFRLDISNLLVFLRLRAEDLSMSDLDSLNTYLFANVNGPSADLKRSSRPRSTRSTAPNLAHRQLVN